ncbi:MAG: DNA polymerase III subunit delta [Clostridia bacterium]|nr:DNA polymerase III subunit delta [Clostridia bacterium]
MEERELTARIKGGCPSGLYFFYGDEDFTKNRRAAELRKAAAGDDPSFAAFNAIDLFFGEGELDLGAIRDAVSSPPLMSPFKCVTVSHSALDSLKEKERTALLDLIRSFAGAVPDTALVVKATSDGFDPGTKKKPSAFLREAMKFMDCVEFPYETESRLGRWMERHFAEYGLTAGPGAIQRILAVAGHSMYRLEGEVSKIGAYAAARGADSVTVDDVNACIARTEEEDAFALANAVLAGDTAEALRILNLKKGRREEPSYVLAQVTKAIADLETASLFAAEGRDRIDFARTMKMNEYRAGLYYRAASQASPKRLAALTEAAVAADRAMKTGASGYLPIERLICSQSAPAQAAGGAR